MQALRAAHRARGLNDDDDDDAQLDCVMFQNKTFNWGASQNCVSLFRQENSKPNQEKLHPEEPAFDA